MTDPISPLLFADYSRPKEGIKKDRRDLRAKRKHERRGTRQIASSGIRVAVRRCVENKEREKNDGEETRIDASSCHGASRILVPEMPAPSNEGLNSPFPLFSATRMEREREENQKLRRNHEEEKFE